MRWYGPLDPVSLEHMAQAGCTHVVTALHAIPVGEVWDTESIRMHREQIESRGLAWTVVESLPVSEAVKTQSGPWRQHLDNYKTSLRNLAEAGIRVVTYNFMPILDWLRTDVAYPLPNGAEALLFDRTDYAIVDLFRLKRPGAREEYTPEEIQELEQRYATMEPTAREALFRNILLGLPGSDVPFTPEQILAFLQSYREIDAPRLKTHLCDFLAEVAPVADELGVQLAIHPDDPPFSVLGLPRILSTAQDIEDLIRAVPNKSNGLCFCTGSLGVRPDNDLVEMIKKYGSRIHFLHLRNTRRVREGAFIEAEHLDGDTDMYAVMEEIVRLMQREERSIPMRPDHGHKMLDDLPKAVYPGYSAIGRLKGLAELRGLEYGIQRSLSA
jgi:mannonate dehydratase